MDKMLPTGKLKRGKVLAKSALKIGISRSKSYIKGGGF